MTPPKIVPYWFVSLGMVTTRSAILASGWRVVGQPEDVGAVAGVVMVEVRWWEGGMDVFGCVCGVEMRGVGNGEGVA